MSEITFTTNQQKSNEVCEKLYHVRTNNADKYHIFQKDMHTNLKLKSNRKQILNVVRFHCYVCYDSRKIKKSDAIYYQYPCLSDSAYVSSKFAIVCLKKNVDIVCTSLLFDTLLEYMYKNDWNSLMIAEIEALRNHFKKEDYTRICVNANKPHTNPLLSDIQTIYLDVSKVFATFFSMMCDSNIDLGLAN